MLVAGQITRNNLRLWSSRSGKKDDLPSHRAIPHTTAKRLRDSMAIPIIVHKVGHLVEHYAYKVLSIGTKSNHVLAGRMEKVLNFCFDFD